MTLSGRVNSLDEPEVTITLLLKGKRHRFRAVIDTGFNGYLSVPLPLAMGWYFSGYEEYEIATGDIVRQKVYLGKIVWNRRIRYVYAVTSRSRDILIGTKLLKRNRLAINFPDRKVLIRWIASPLKK